jgi:outer membrane protein insertion porin family
VRKDIQNIFNMGFYQDIQVEWLGEGNRWVLVYRVKEKPSVRAIRYEGNEEITADDIAEVVDIKPFSILDLAKVKRNSVKIKDLYVEKSFFLAEVSWDIVEAPDNQMDIVFRIQEKQEVKVAQVKIVGNHHVETSLFKQRMMTQEEGLLSFVSSSGSFKSENFERDRMVIMQTYYEQGYMQARVSQPLVELSADKKKVYITIPVEEGIRFKFGGFQFTGDLLFSEEELSKSFELKAGEWFNSIKYGTGAEKLGELYKDKGFAYVNVIPNFRMEESSKTVNIDIQISKGPIVKIGKIEIVGNTTTRDKVIRREMRIYEGDDYSSELLKRSERLITRLGYFETVKDHKNILVAWCSGDFVEKLSDEKINHDCTMVLRKFFNDDNIPEPIKIIK